MDRTWRPSRFLGLGVLLLTLSALPRVADAEALRLECGTLIDVSPGETVTLPVYTNAYAKVGALQIIVKLQAIPATEPLPQLKTVTLKDVISQDTPALDVNPTTQEFLAAWPFGGNFTGGEGLRLKFAIPAEAAPGTRYTVCLAPKYVIGTDYKDLPYKLVDGDILVKPAAPAPGDVSPPSLSLTYPAPLAPVAGRVTLKGSVSDEGEGASGLYYYLLEAGEGENPTNFRKVALGSAPLSDGVLGQWDTEGLPAGIYTVRLTAHDFAGNTVQTTNLLSVRDIKVGDTDRNNLVNVKDVIVILEITVHFIEPDVDLTLAADVDGNGLVNVKDAIKLLKRVAGLES